MLQTVSEMFVAIYKPIYMHTKYTNQTKRHTNTSTIASVDRGTYYRKAIWNRHEKTREKRKRVKQRIIEEVTERVKKELWKS